MTRPRSDELQIEAIGRLEDALGIPNECIIPIAIAQESDHLDPRVAVGASITASSRNNKRQEVTASVRVLVDGTKSFVESNDLEHLTDSGTLALSQIQSNVIDELTRHTSTWNSQGVTSEEEIAWTDGVNRYLGVVECGFESNETQHPAYD